MKVHFKDTKYAILQALPNSKASGGWLNQCKNRNFRGATLLVIWIGWRRRRLEATDFSRAGTGSWSREFLRGACKCVPHLRDKTHPTLPSTFLSPPSPPLLTSPHPQTPQIPILIPGVINHRTDASSSVDQLEKQLRSRGYSRDGAATEWLGSLYQLTRDKLHRRTSLWRLIRRIRPFVYFPEERSPRNCWQKFRRWYFRQRYFINTEVDQRCVFADIKLSRKKKVSSLLQFSTENGFSFNHLFFWKFALVHMRNSFCGEKRVEREREIVIDFNSCVIGRVAFLLRPSN